MLQTPLHPDAVDVHGRSALVAASGQGHVQAVGLLLEANADKDRNKCFGRYWPDGGFCARPRGSCAVAAGGQGG